MDGTRVPHAAKLYRPDLENRAYLELARLLADPVLRGHGVPGGDGRAVLLLPGYLAGDRSLSLLARFLRRIGYLPVFSGIAFNSGCAGGYERRIIDAVRHARQSTGRPIAVVGHRRGGHYAKSIAAAHPGDVSHVVFLGSGLDAVLDVYPVTALSAAVSRRGLALASPARQASGCLTSGAPAHCRPATGNRSRGPSPNLGLTRRNGVVRWESCLADYATCVEVPGSHIGLAFNRHVYRAIAQALTTPPNRRGEHRYLTVS